jgi:type IV pilus assembly protein PilY1
VLERRLATCLLFAAITASSPVLADTTFGPGSIIIPAPAVYQSDCGAVSIYGVVYNVLRANGWLFANGHGKIEIYYAYKETKASPNRCTPTNLQAGPAYTGVPTPLHNDVKWNDGCDFAVVSAAAVPVSRIVNATATNPATDQTSWATVSTTGKTSGGTATFPNWPAVTVQDTGVPATDVHTVRYYGGSFVVADTDATTFRRLIEGTLVANDADGNTISFATFKNGGACSYGTSSGGTVFFHKANAGFTAPTPKFFTTPPPRLALLGRDNNSKTGTITDGVLQDYLRFAGLNFPGAQGCPLGGFLATNSPALCPSPNKTGQIFDLFDFQDLIDGRLSTTVLGLPVYKMFWAPHWDLNNTAPNANERAAMDNIAAFLNNQRGLMAECASIESLEGTPDEPSDGYTPAQFQSCRDVAGACSGNVTRGFRKNSGAGETTAIRKARSRTAPTRRYRPARTASSSAPRAIRSSRPATIAGTVTRTAAARRSPTTSRTPVHATGRACRSWSPASRVSTRPSSVRPRSRAR